MTVFRQIRELDTVVGEHRVDAVWNRFDEDLEEGGSGPDICPFDQFDSSEPAMCA